MQQNRVTIKTAEDAPPSSEPAPIMAAPARKFENVGGREYKYFTEISQMMFVFGEVQDPMAETVNLVEDIVRSQIIELVSGRVLVLLDLATYRVADITSKDVGLTPRSSLPLSGGSHIPHTTRQSKGQQVTNVLVLEGREETRQRLWGRWRRCRS